MKTYSERFAEVTGKMREFRRRKVQKRLSITAAAAAVLTLVLFFPLNVEPPNVRAYSDSPYYELIKKIDQANGGEPGYKNLFTAITQKLAPKQTGEKVDTTAPMPTVPPEDNTQEVADDKYVDLNFEDDTLPGMTDGDVVLYTDDYIFRLNYNLLKVFSRNGDQSEKISEYRINAKLLVADGKYEKYESFGEKTQMFLSEDAATVTVLIPAWLKTMGNNDYTLLVQLDVSDPENIRETDRLYVSGYPWGVWMMDGELLIVGDYDINSVLDYSAVETYVPLTGEAGLLQPIPAEDIVLTEDTPQLHYTVLYKVDMDTLQVSDQLAVLSRGWHSRVYLTEDYLFTTCEILHTQEASSLYENEGDIACFRYRDELEIVGSTAVSGGISGMDLHNGVLRLISAQSAYNKLPSFSLYCLDVPDLSVISVTEDISPGGRPGSVVFRGDVLSFQNRGFTSGVYGSYIYDLSDPEKVTFRQGEIAVELKENLVKWTDDYWLGICPGDEEYSMILELFRETEEGLCSVQKYELDAAYASDADTLYVDPARGLLGMVVHVELCSDPFTSHWADYFLVLKFTDGNWQEVARELVGQHRVLPLDNWIYLVYNDVRAIPIS